jgi:hypothetical protein
MQRFFDASGQSMLLLVLIFGATILGVTTLAGYISIQKVRTATDAVDSAKAVYAADYGVERCFYEKYVYGSATSTCNFILYMDNDAKVSVTESGPVVKSIGQVGRSFRAFGLFSL